MLRSRMLASHLRCAISALLLLCVQASAAAPGKRKCDFEDGWCTWKNKKSSNGDLAWLLGSENLEPTLLRPSKDHTRGSAKGSYLLLSNFERNTGERADLIGDVLPSGSGLTPCVEFWYDISADNDTILTLLATNVAGKARREEHLWTQRGAGKGGSWNMARVAAPRGSKLVFRGTVGPASKPGYIALDDISVNENDRCKTLPKGADQVPVGSLLSCDFNGGDLCQWSSEVQNEAAKWVFGPPAGSTLGPVLAPKTGEGGMIYLNGPALFANKKPVDLTSPIVTGPQQEAACFSFWYHMFAGRDAELALYQIGGKKSDEVGRELLLFKHPDRTTADRWYNVRLTVLLGAKINQACGAGTMTTRAVVPLRVLTSRHASAFVNVEGIAFQRLEYMCEW
ncbi:MAM and LDL-receptor class A domain-containing protein 2-like [Dermacentor variabilis]|uniref:MAM and LDL-receptor class A domain-containing protein 2-like n=1 Tax=Dermacentor variabilis TaxID=34621 RepID=UPI003F5BACD6